MRPHFSEEWLTGVMAKQRVGGSDVRSHARVGINAGTEKPHPASSLAGAEKQNRRARAGSNPAPSPYKSKLEAAWAQHLTMLQYVGALDGWAYEPLNFRLPGKKNFYKVDFSAWKDGAVTLFEVKGFNRSDDRSLVKMKTAAGLNPWAQFILVKHISGQWEERIVA